MLSLGVLSARELGETTGDNSDRGETRKPAPNLAQNDESPVRGLGFLNLQLLLSSFRWEFVQLPSCSPGWSQQSLLPRVCLVQDAPCWT